MTRSMMRIRLQDFLFEFMDDELVEVEPHTNHFSTATASVHVWIYWALLPFP